MSSLWALYFSTYSEVKYVIEVFRKFRVYCKIEASRYTRLYITIIVWPIQHKESGHTVQIYAADINLLPAWYKTSARDKMQTTSNNLYLCGQIVSLCVVFPKIWG